MKRYFSLSPRLQAVADLVPEGSTYVDIGTDHGRLPVWLLQHDRIQYAVATDLRPAPLARAQELAERWGIGTDKISFRLCDGLSAIHPDEAQTVTIAGMGGETIADILDAVKWTREPGHLYILQAMSGMDGLRRYLSQNGFTIGREHLVREGETIYIVLTAEFKKDIPLTEGEIWVGRQSLALDDPLRGDYLKQELAKLCHAVSGLEYSKRPEDHEKKRWYELAAQEVARMEKEWNLWQQ